MPSSRRSSVGGAMLALGALALVVFVLPFAFPTPPPIVTQFRSSAIVSPNGDGRREVARVFVRLREPGDVSLEIQRDGSTVRRIVDGRLPRGRVVREWDGRDDAGRLVPDASYALKLRVRSGRKRFNTTRRVTVDTEPPTAALAVGSAALGARGPGQCRIVLQADGATVRIAVRPAEGGDPVRTLGPRPVRADEPLRIVWGGDGPSGRPVPPGLYRVTADVFDAVRNGRRRVATCWVGHLVGTARPVRPRPGRRIGVSLRRPGGRPHRTRHARPLGASTPARHTGSRSRRSARPEGRGGRTRASPLRERTDPTVGRSRRTLARGEHSRRARARPTGARAMSADAVREIASVAAAAGIVVAFLPSGLAGTNGTRRLLGGAIALAAWVALALSLVPAHDLEALGARLARPATAGAAILGLALLAVLAALCARGLLARPVVWFVLLALAMPVRIPVTLRSLEANLLVPLYAVIALGTLLWVVGRARGRLGAGPPRETPIDLPLALFVGYLLVSTLWSADPEEAAVKAVFFYLPFVALYRLVVLLWPTAPALRALVTTTLAIAVPISLLALLQSTARGLVFWNESLQQANVYSRLYRVNSIFFDPNILGRFLVLALLAGLAVVLLGRVGGRREAVLWAALAVIAAGLVVTFSRSSALGLLVGLTMIGWRVFGARKALVTVTALVVVLGGIAILASPKVRGTLTSSQRLERVSEGRFDLMRGGLDIWRDDPVAGAGLGAFERRFEQALGEREQRRTRVVVSHNTPITVLSEGGVVGFGLFVLLVLVSALALARAARDRGEAGLVQLTMLAMLASILVHSLLYSGFFEDPYTWVIAGAALGAAAVAPVPAARAARDADGAVAAT